MVGLKLAFGGGLRAPQGQRGSWIITATNVEKKSEKKMMHEEFLSWLLRLSTPSVFETEDRFWSTVDSREWWNGGDGFATDRAVPLKASFISMG